MLLAVSMHDAELLFLQASREKLHRWLLSRNCRNQDAKIQAARLLVNASTEQVLRQELSRVQSQLESQNKLIESQGKTITGLKSEIKVLRGLMERVSVRVTTSESKLAEFERSERKGPSRGGANHTWASVVSGGQLSIPSLSREAKQAT